MALQRAELSAEHSRILNMPLPECMLIYVHSFPTASNSNWSLTFYLSTSTSDWLVNDMSSIVDISVIFGVEFEEFSHLVCISAKKLSISTQTPDTQQQVIGDVKASLGVNAVASVWVISY